MLENEDHIIKRRGLVRLMSIIPSMAAFVTFIMTQDIRNPMIWTDKWTFLMAMILVAQMLVAYLSIKRHYYISEIVGQEDLKEKLTKKAKTVKIKRSPA